MKNIWNLYIAPLILLVGIFTYTQVISYYDTAEEIALESRYYNRIFAATMHSSLHEVELLLDVLGSQLLANNLYKDAHQSRLLMEDLLSRNTSLVGFGLTDPAGNFIAVSDNIDSKKTKNLLELEEMKHTFLETIESHSMILGRIYYFKGIKQWILPLRKTLRNSSGAVIGVMTTSITVNTATFFWKEEPRINGQTSMLVKDIGLWTIYVNPIDPEKYQSIYAQPIPKEIFNEALQKINKGPPLEKLEIRDQCLPCQYEGTLLKGEQQSVITMEYDKRFKTWAITAVPISTIRAMYWHRFSKQFSGFVGGLLLFLFLFGKIYKKEKSIKNALTFQARHDPLTSLLNRSSFDEVFQKWIQPDTPHFSLFYIDLDNFKHINDTYGHTAGDNILIEVSRRLKNISPRSSEIIRHGGDEFALFTAVQNPTSVKNLAKNIIQSISTPYNISDIPISLGASIGISNYPEDGTSKEELMVSADLALYDAKRKRNSYSFFNRDLQASMQKKTIIERHLRDALHQNEIYMAYQPQIKRDGTIGGLEALVRWKNSKLGAVSPDVFINITEDSGLMPQLGHHIFERSCADFAHINNQCNTLYPDLSLSINVSVRQIIEQDFQEHLLQVLQNHELSHSKIILEITESLFINELNYILPLLKNIQKTGMKLSLDDFGTGYSSLSVLRTLPINELKIDRSFVGNIIEVQQDADMVRSIIDMGHTMGMTVLAEGVENKQQHDALLSCGCDLFQGFHFSKPLTVDEVIAFLNSTHISQNTTLTTSKHIEIPSHDSMPLSS